jgi:hypothetical protein
MHFTSETKNNIPELQALTLNLFYRGLLLRSPIILFLRSRRVFLILQISLIVLGSWDDIDVSD